MYLLFDIGGTKTRLATSNDGETLENIKSFETPDALEEGLLAFEKYISSLGIKKLNMVSGSLPGTFDKDRSMLLWSKNLEGWINKPIKTDLAKRLNADVILCNDAKAAGLGEALFGAGKGERVVAYLTVSTGVGGARIVDGKLDEDSLNFEPGYQIIDLDGSTDKSFLTPNDRYPNEAGYLQRLISGRDLEIKMGKPLEDIGDREVWEKIAKYLAIGLNNLTAFWWPDVIILGGGVALSKYLKVETIEKYLREYLIIFKLPIIKKAELGDDSGLYGALALTKDKFKATFKRG